MAYILELIYAILAKLTNMTWPEFMQPHVDNFVQWVNGVLEYWDLEYLEVCFLIPNQIVFVFFDRDYSCCLLM